MQPSEDIYDKTPKTKESNSEYKSEAVNSIINDRTNDIRHAISDFIISEEENINVKDIQNVNNAVSKILNCTLSEFHNYLMKEIHEKTSIISFNEYIKRIKDWLSSNTKKSNIKEREILITLKLVDDAFNMQEATQ